MRGSITPKQPLPVIGDTHQKWHRKKSVNGIVHALIFYLTLYHSSLFSKPSEPSSSRKSSTGSMNFTMTMYRPFLPNFSPFLVA
ncbi:hypothetical protein [Ruminococcus sp.]|uniref:hypothetical protein n=1 Tax=Ruminococcus sp. TaxID=41978 RepID=UPI0034212B21